MTITTAERVLDRLGDSGLSTADLGNVPYDVSGQAIYDRFGTEVGTVADVLVSRRLLEAPFLIVAWGGILGLLRHQRLVPMELVTVRRDGIAVDGEREQIRSGPAFDDAMNEDETELHYLAVADHYGVRPYWSRVSNR